MSRTDYILIINIGVSGNNSDYILIIRVSGTDPDYIMIIHVRVSGTDPDYIMIIRVSGTDPDGHNCYLSPEEVSAISADNLEYSPGFVQF